MVRLREGHEAVDTSSGLRPRLDDDADETEAQDKARAGSLSRSLIQAEMASDNDVEPSAQGARPVSQLSGLATRISSRASQLRPVLTRLKTIPRYRHVAAAAHREVLGLTRTAAAARRRDAMRGTTKLVLRRRLLSQRNRIGSLLAMVTAYAPMESETEGAGHRADEASLEEMKQQAQKEMAESERNKEEERLKSAHDLIKDALRMLKEMAEMQSTMLDLVSNA